jgi:hypothetical protein
VLGRNNCYWWGCLHATDALHPHRGSLCIYGRQKTRFDLNGFSVLVKERKIKSGGSFLTSLKSPNLLFYERQRGEGEDGAAMSPHQIFSMFA